MTEQSPTTSPGDELPSPSTSDVVQPIEESPEVAEAVAGDTAVTGFPVESRGSDPDTPEFRGP